MKPALSDSGDFLSPLELVLLRELWSLGAVGAKSVTTESLNSRTRSLPAGDLANALGNLSKRELVTSLDHSGPKSYALTALGIALVRQLHEFDLEKLGRG